MASVEKKKSIVLLLMMLLDDDRTTRKRKSWCRDWLLRRAERGAFHMIFKELALEDTAGFNEYMRMPYDKFVALVEAVTPLIQKKDTIMRDSIKPNERLALTIRFLATGESFQSLSFQFRIGRTTISNIVMEVCVAICDVFGKDYLRTPNQANKWDEIAQLFQSRWNLPNCIGAIDGKRILIQKPAYAGSHFHDYKGNESIIALIVAGPEYECLYVDIGTNGRNPDGHAWSRCSLKKALDDRENPLNIPVPCPLPGRTTEVPFVLVGDEAFPLSKFMLKPFPSKNLTVEHRIANYRISRAMGNRWRCFRSPFSLPPCKVQQITLAVLTLHNWLRADATSRNIYSPPTLIDREDPEAGEVTAGLWRTNTPTDSFLDLRSSSSRNYTNEAKGMREEFTSWFNNEGDLPWQRKMCGL